MNYMQQLFFLAFGLTYSLAPQLSRAADQSSESEFLEEMPMVLTASRLLQPLSEVPVTMSVIDRTTIEASGLRSIAELFRLVPGMYVRPGLGIEGVVPVVSYHGMTNEFSRRMQVLIDGRSVYLPPFSTVLWDDLPIAVDDIERIEITRGPNAASYGANAFFGTVNIITRTPETGEGAYALARAGQLGVRDGIFRYTSSADGLNYRVTAGARSDDGFQNVDSQDPIYSGQEHKYLTARLEGTLNPQDLLQIQIGYSGGDRNQGFYDSAVDRPRTKGVDDEYAQLKWLRATEPGKEIFLQYYYERKSVREQDVTLPIPLPGPPPVVYVLHADYQFDRHEIELQQTLTPSADLRVVWGTAAQFDEVDAPIYFGGRSYVSSNLQQLYAHAEWRTSSVLLLQAGGMLERTSLAGIDLSPRISATYQVDENHVLRASASGATRTPSLFEAEGNFGLTFGSIYYPVQISGGNLKSERLISSEIGYHGNRLFGFLQIDLKCYRDHASRMIDEYSNANLVNALNQVTELVNIDDAHVTGLEAEIHTDLGPNTRTLLSYAYEVISSIPQPGTPGLVRTIPRNLLGALGEQRFGASWAASLALYLNSGLPAQSGVPGQSDQLATAFGHRLDGRLSRKFHLAGMSVTAAVGVLSITGDFVEFRPETTFTRQIYIELIAKP